MKKYLCLFSFLALALQAELAFQVSNSKYERLQCVVSQELSEQQAHDAKACSLYEIGENGLKTRVPAYLEQLDGKTTLVWLMPGLTKAGQVRTFALDTAHDKLVPVNSMLKKAIMGEYLAISNSYYSLEHPMKGEGGLPQNLRFRMSGKQEKEIKFYDRIYRKETGQYHLSSDAENETRILSENPLRIIVETRGYYAEGSGKHAIGNPRATYRWYYTAFSPRVLVTAKMEKDDDHPWNELHFLHPSVKNRIFDRFVTSGPEAIHNIALKGQGGGAYAAGKWAVMENDQDALGVGGSVSCWDASTQYVYYIRSISGANNFKVRSLERRGSLYFGPSIKSSDWYAQYLEEGSQPNVSVVSVAVKKEEQLSPMTGDYLLGASGIHLAFGSAERGFPILGIEAPLAPVRFCNSGEEAAPLWRMSFCKGGDVKTVIHVDASTKAGRVERSAQCFTFLWDKIPLEREGKNFGDVDMKAVVKLEGARAKWRFTVENHSEYGLWESECPILGQVLKPGEGDALVPHGNWGGRLHKNNFNSAACVYPSSACPLQCFAFMKDGYGLYYATEDAGARAKTFFLSAPQTLSCKLSAENMGVPGSGRNDDFDTVIELFKGDWWKAAEIYRNWALANTPWAAKGPIAKRADYPEGLRKVGFWNLLSGTPEKIKAGMDESLAKVPVATGVHWYCWHEIPFDNSYPNYYPTKPGVAEATQEMIKRGQFVMPYINGRLWDRDIENFAAAKPYACLKENGELYVETYGSGRYLCPMCPCTSCWQDKVFEICNRLVNETGVNGIYLDQIGAARPRLCFNPEHKHPLGGGRHWVDGYRVLLTRVKKMAMEKGTFLTTENTAEPYMDNIDGYLVWNPRGEDDVPLLPAVYSGYTIYFSSPQHSADSDDAFCAAQGRDFLWGCQLGWNDVWLYRKDNAAKLAFSNQLCQMRMATSDFMVDGFLIGQIYPKNPIQVARHIWNRTKPHTASLPVADGTIWRDLQGNLCYYIVNYSKLPQTFTCELAMPWKKTLLSRVTPAGEAPWELTEAKSRECSFQLAPREILVLKATEAKATPKELMKQASKFLRQSNSTELAIAASQFIFRQEAPVTLKATSVVEYAYGETPVLMCSLVNLGKSRKVILYWPDGKEEEVELPSKSEKSFMHSLALGTSARLPIPRPGQAMTQVGIEVSLPGKEGSLWASVILKQVEPIEIHLDLPEEIRSGESCQAMLTVTNHTSVARQPQVQLQVPADWTVEPSRNFDFGTLEAGASSGIMLRVVPAPQEADSQVNLRAVLVQNSIPVRTTVRRASPVLPTPKAKAVKLDGDLSEWGNGQAAKVGGAIPATVKIAKYEGDKDCSAELRAAWDEENLYLAAVVKDNIHNQPYRNESIWSGDAIQIAIREGGPGTIQGMFDGKEREFALALSNDGEAFVYVWGGKQGDGVTKEARIAARQSEGQVVYEAAIPWSLLSFSKPAAGGQYGFSFTVNDRDDKDFRGWLEWTVGICGGKDSASFGKLKLTEK